MDLHERFAGTPCNRFLGLQLVACSPARAELLLPVRPEFLQEEGVVQGGLLTALADTAAVYLLHPFLPPELTMTGTSCTMHFLGAGLATGGSLRAVAEPVRIGRTLAVCTSTVTQGERQVAVGTFTFLLRARRGGS